MLQKFNYFEQHEIPNIRLCNPNKTQLCFLNSGYDKELSLRFNEMSEFHMTVPEEIDGEPFPYYEMIQAKRLILIDDIGYFIISEVTEEDDSLSNKKTVTAYSLEAELGYKKINLFEGTYPFYDPMNPQKSLLSIVLDSTGWDPGNIDSDLWNIHRTFDIPDSTVYEFLMNDIEQTFECIFIFNTFTRTVDAYKVEHVLRNTDILMSYDNLVSNLSISEKSDELITALSVYGGGDLSIAGVNPLGTPTMYNFDYFKNTDWMSQSLIDALNKWEAKYETQQKNYADLMTKYKDANAKLIELKAEEEEKKDILDQSTVEVKADIVDVDVVNTDKYKQDVVQMDFDHLEWHNKKTEVSEQEKKVQEIQKQLDAVHEDLDFKNNFTKEQLTELSYYIIENTYQNDSFIQTKEMTNVEIQESEQELYDLASSVLEKVSNPRYEFSVDSVNFLYLKEFLPFINQLQLGCVIFIQRKCNKIIAAFLLEINQKLDDPTQFSMTFGNRYKLDSAEYSFKDLFGDAISAGSSVKFDGTKWGEYVNSGMNTQIADFMNSALDAAKNNVINAENQELTISAAGLRGKEALAEGIYSSEQVWLTSNTLAFTQDNWQTASLALGKIKWNNTTAYGIVTDKPAFGIIYEME